MRRACCEFTSSISMFLGSFMEALIALFVSSLKVILFVSSIGIPRTFARCHEIASPSRSGSVAK